MKLFAILLTIFGFASVAFALKNEICGLQHSMIGDVDRQCRALIPMYSFNSATGECVKFNYGGCGGNDNRFKSKDECENACKE